MNVNEFLTEASEALGNPTVESLEGFLMKWVPIVSNTVSALQQEKLLLELALTEAQEE